MVRIASFNVENLFLRARAMNLSTWEEGKQVLADYSSLNALISKPVYSDADKQTMLQIITRLGLDQSDETECVILRQNKGRFLRRPQVGGPEIAASGRGSWIGWLELKTESVDETATQMTARVIQDVNADILAVVEAENRIALIRFNEQLLKPIHAAYPRIMLLDGNDERGIDVGLMIKENCAIEWIASHVDDRISGQRIFSRDCPEYMLSINGTAAILVLINHLKSKGYGSTASSNARRKAQAQRVREIYDLRRSQGLERIAIVGDFNDTPLSDPLSPLLGNGSDLKDIFDHPLFQSDGRPGTFGNGNKSNKIDYILLSPALFGCVAQCGVWRKGVWGGVHGTLFPHYPEITEAIHSASDHAAIWADIEL